MTYSKGLLRALDEFRDVVLNQRFGLAENGMTNDQVNDVLGEFDCIVGPHIEAIRAEAIQPDSQPEGVVVPVADLEILAACARAGEVNAKVNYPNLEGDFSSINAQIQKMLRAAKDPTK